MRTSTRPAASGDTWHRFDGSITVHYRTFAVIATTPRGVWLVETFRYSTFRGDKRFCLLTSRKRFACATIDEAKASFLARKTRQSRILRRQLDDVKSIIVNIDSYIHESLDTRFP